MTLFYCPLEAYKERYTMQWSAPITGWLERNWIAADIHYTRIDGIDPPMERTNIKTGCVLDAVGRSVNCFSQIKQLLMMAESGIIHDSDEIYFDDFWHPGIEALPYAFHLMGLKPKMYAFLHAQSVDEFDFTHPMRSWMRHFERGIAEALTGIFVCGPCLQDLVVFGGIAPRSKVHVTGHPFNSEEVLERMPPDYVQFVKDTVRNEDDSPVWSTLRKNKVVYSSRWDAEKNPWFFLNVAREVIKRRPETEFVICTGSRNIKSNDVRNIDLLTEAMYDLPNNITLLEGLTKEAYYAELCDAKVQMNTADQDFVAITLLESSVAGCYPIYPYFRSFPETFLYKPGFMYERLNVQSAADLTCSILERDDLWTHDAIKSREWIHHRFDSSWKRMLTVMGYGHFTNDEEANADPYCLRR